MNADEIRTRLAKVFEQVLGQQVALRDELKPGDVEGWDSIAHVTVVLAVEREFKVKFKGADIANLVSVGDLVRAIVAKNPTV